MSISLALLAVALFLVFWTFRHQAGRNAFTGFAAWVFNISSAMATAVLAYLAYAVLSLAIMAGIVFLGLALNWPWIIYLGLVLFGILLAVVTFIVELPLNTLATCLAGIRKAATEAVQALKLDIKAEAVDTASIETIVAALTPEAQAKIKPYLAKSQRWLDWALSMFGKAVDPAIIRGLGTSVIHATLGNAESMVNAAMKNIAGIKIALLWFGVVLFFTMFIPDQATGAYLLPLGIGIALLVIIANYMGLAWRQAHGLGDIYWTAFRLIKYGVWVCVIAIAWLAISPARVFIPHILVAMHVKGPQYEEELAKEWFGQRYDQNVVVVCELGTAYPLDQNGRPTQGILLHPGTNLWKTKADQILLGGSYYGTYMRRANNGAQEPDPTHLVLFAESLTKTTTLTNPNRVVTVVKKSQFYIDTNGDGQPEPDPYVNDKSDMVVQVTASQTYLAGGELIMCLRLDDPHYPNYPIWLTKQYLASL